ncbi:MAG: ABC transporter ATP-binding protein [Eubacteriales bacterium]|nr:ABC transporter ATP-binding protein [Eubacteriales bacterium]
MIDLKHVNVRYNGETILEDINLHVSAGECLLVTGLSGSGKSTLLKLINGLIPHFDRADVEGEIQVAGINPRDEALYVTSRKVASVFQNPKTSFFNTDTRSELLFYLENRGFPREEMKRRMDACIEHFKIEQLMDRSIFQLSGGEKQILSIASCLITGNEIIVLDEPTSNLDEIYSAKISDMLRELKSMGKTLIIAEHRFPFIRDLVDRAIYLEAGRLRFEKSGQDFFALSESERKSLGLRSLHKSPPPKTTFIGGNDYRIESLKLPFVHENRCLKIDSLGFEKSKLIGLTGRNGIGKSSLLRNLIGQSRPAGAVYFEAQRLSRRTRIQRSFLVMQDVNAELFSDSVLEECQIGNHCSREDCLELLARLHLEDLIDRHPVSLSGGQKQRLVIALALLSKRPILFFDEPSSGMDYFHMQQIATLLREIKEDRIVFVITHDLELIEAAVDEIISVEDFSQPLTSKH